MPADKTGWFRASVVLIVASVSGYFGSVLLSGNTASESAPVALTRAPGKKEGTSKSRPAAGSPHRFGLGEQSRPERARAARRLIESAPAAACEADRPAKRGKEQS